MAYSRKGWWINLSACFLLFGLWVLTVRLGHWNLYARGISGFIVAVIAVALATRAFFFQDEIQKQSRMREWYFGSLIGILATLAIVVCARMYPGTLLSFFHPNPGRSTAPGQYMTIGLAIGFTMTCLLQVVGALLARAVAALRTSP